MLVHQIESVLHRRQGKVLTNFKATLPALQSELAQQVLKDPYNFDFLTLSEDARERELESGLLEHLLEMGRPRGCGPRRHGPSKLTDSRTTRELRKRLVC